MKSCIILMYLTALIFARSVLAYEVLTHEDMSEAAAFSSTLTEPETLAALGLAGTIDDPNLMFPNSAGTAKQIKFLIP